MSDNIALGTIIVTAIVAVIGKIVFDWLKERKDNGLKGSVDSIFSKLDKMDDTLQRTKDRITELHQWHNHDMPDNPGVKIWWNTVIAKALLTHAEIVKKQEETTELLITAIKDLKNEIRKSNGK